MKKSLNICLVLIVALLIVFIGGCSNVDPKASDQASAQEQQEASASEKPDSAQPEPGDAQEESDVQISEADEETEESSEESPEATGQTAGSAEDSSEAGEQPADTDNEAAGQFTFNPHVYSTILGTVYGEEYWEGLYNLIDALRAGEDTFECASEEVYKWCVNPARLLDLFPGGSFALQDLFLLPEDAYEDGVGKICYAMDKQEFLEKEAAFEEDLMKVVNDYVDPDYTEFEKCLALLDYVASTCHYNHDGEPYGGSLCRPLYEHTGECGHFGLFYSYLLMQCGVQAFAIENDPASEYPGYHCWTYVIVDGVGYHVDPTWLLKSEYDEEQLRLTYFLMTDAEREEFGFDPDTFQLNCYPDIKVKCTDDRFSALHEGYFEGIDRNNKILYYSVNGITKEFYYGA